MEKKSISGNIAEFLATKNFLYLTRAIYLLVIQRRMIEALYGIYCCVFHPPSIAKSPTNWILQSVTAELELLLSTKDLLDTKDIVEIFGKNYAVHFIPKGFCARIETIVCDGKFLILGEYGQPGKRIAVVTQHTCKINNFYIADPSVLHIHSICKVDKSKNFLVATGDTAKYLDLWVLKDREVKFEKRIKKSLAGYTAIVQIENEHFLGTDFSSRPNYIELLREKLKIPFPPQAYRMYVLRFIQFQNQYLLCLNQEMDCLGGRRALSIFDIKKREFIFCEYLQHRPRKVASKELIRTAILLRSNYDSVNFTNQKKNSSEPNDRRVRHAER